jgi:hypothetical protein
VSARKTKARSPKTSTIVDEPDVAQAIECIDGAIVDIVDAWSMRDEKPDGNCLMSALAGLRTARDHLTPRTGKLANRGAP